MNFSVKITVVDHFMTYSQYYYNQYAKAGYPRTDFIAQDGGPVFPKPESAIPLSLNVLQ